MFLWGYLDRVLLKKWITGALILSFLAVVAVVVFFWIGHVRRGKALSTTTFYDEEATEERMREPHVEDLILPLGDDLLSREFYRYREERPRWTEKEIASYWKEMGGIDLDAISERNRKEIESILEKVP